MTYYTTYLKSCQVILHLSIQVNNTDRYCLMNLTTPFSSMISILYDNLYSITNIFQNTLCLVTFNTFIYTFYSMT